MLRVGDVIKDKNREKPGHQRIEGTICAIYPKFIVVQTPYWKSCLLKSDIAEKYQISVDENRKNIYSSGLSGGT